MCCHRNHHYRHGDRRCQRHQCCSLTTTYDRHVNVNCPIRLVSAVDACRAIHGSVVFPASQCPVLDERHPSLLLCIVLHCVPPSHALCATVFVKVVAINEIANQSPHQPHVQHPCDI